MQSADAKRRIYRKDSARSFRQPPFSLRGPPLMWRKTLRKFTLGRVLSHDPCDTYGGGGLSSIVPHTSSYDRHGDDSSRSCYCANNRQHRMRNNARCAPEKKESSANTLLNVSYSITQLEALCCCTYYCFCRPVIPGTCTFKLQLLLPLPERKLCS